MENYTSSRDENKYIETDRYSRIKRDYLPSKRDETELFLGGLKETPQRYHAGKTSRVNVDELYQKPRLNNIPYTQKEPTFFFRNFDFKPSERKAA